MGGLLWGTARILDPVKLTGELPREDNGAVSAPACSAACSAITANIPKSGCAPASDRYLLQFPVAKESDPLAIRRKERRKGRPGSFEQHGGALVHFSNVESNLACFGIPRGVSDARPVRRNRGGRSVLQCELLVRNQEGEFHWLLRTRAGWFAQREQREQ